MGEKVVVRTSQGPVAATARPSTEQGFTVYQWQGEGVPSLVSGVNRYLSSDSIELDLGSPSTVVYLVVSIIYSLPTTSSQNFYGNLTNLPSLAITVNDGNGTSSRYLDMDPFSPAQASATSYGTDSFNVNFNGSYSFVPSGAVTVTLNFSVPVQTNTSPGTATWDGTIAVIQV